MVWVNLQMLIANVLAACMYVDWIQNAYVVAVSTSYKFKQLGA